MKPHIILILALSVLFSNSANAFFSDVDSNHPNGEAIFRLYQDGVINGYPDGSYKPDKTVSRIEALKILLLGSGIDPAEAKSDFFDVSDSHWGHRFIVKAKQSGIVGGYEDGSFKPDNTITTIEALKMLLKTKGITPQSANYKPFEDTPVGVWYTDFAAFAKEKGVLDSRQNLEISKQVTRGDLAEMMYRLNQVEDVTQSANVAVLDMQLYPVTKVVDGDTLKVNINGTEETIRVIGIDTPETVHPSKPVECFGIEASNKAKELLTGASVGLESDPSQGDRDNYGRILRYVILEDGTNFNELMIKEGYAHEYTYRIPYQKQAEFKAAEVFAMNRNLGLWGDVCADEQTETVEYASDYECGSNTFNCSDFKSQKEAQAVYDYCMGQVRSDIHKLDADKNGVACESL